MKKIYTFRGPKGKNGPPELKNGIEGPKSLWCDIFIVWEFYIEQEKIFFLGFRAQKRNFGPKIGMFVWYIHRLGILRGARKNNLLGGQIGQKRNVGPKKSKINVHTKKIKTSRHFKNCTLKMFLSNSKQKKKS
jgi:hypothetical protein